MSDPTSFTLKTTPKMDVVAQEIVRLYPRSITTEAMAKAAREAHKTVDVQSDAFDATAKNLDNAAAAYASTSQTLCTKLDELFGLAKEENSSLFPRKTSEVTWENHLSATRAAETQLKTSLNEFLLKTAQQEKIGALPTDGQYFDTNQSIKR